LQALAIPWAGYNAVQLIQNKAGENLCCTAFAEQDFREIQRILDGCEHADIIQSDTIELFLAQLPPRKILPPPNTIAMP